MFVNHVSVTRALVIIVLSTLINCKSIQKRDTNDDRHSNAHLNQPVVLQSGNISHQTEKKQDVTNQNEDVNRTGTNHGPEFELPEIQNQVDDLLGPERDKRGQTSENSTPTENFRNKLLAARNKLKEMKLKTQTPTIFVIDQNRNNEHNSHSINEDPIRADHRQILRITNHAQYEPNPMYEYYEPEYNSGENIGMTNENANLSKMRQNVPLGSKKISNKGKQKATAGDKSINKTQFIQDEIGQKEQNLKETNFDLNDVHFEKLLNDSLKNKDKSTFPSDGLEQLIEIREEINKLRSLMQVVKEQQMKQHFSNTFLHHLKPEEQKQLQEFVEKLKQSGQISTTPNMNSSTELENKSTSLENNETTILTKDIKNLRITVLDFMKKLKNEKVNAENLEKLEREYVNQQEEIETLKIFLEKLVPAMIVLNETNFESASEIEERNNEKEKLHNEIMNMRDIFYDGDDDESKPEETVGDSLSNQTKSEDVALLENPIKKDVSEDDLDFMKIFQKLTNSREVSDSKSVESKIEKLERDLKDLENLNHRTRQEMLLEKLERDIKNLKPINVNEKTKDEKPEISKEPENISKNTNIAQKLEDLQKQIKLMSKPETRDLNDSGIEKELSILQEKIDKLGQRQNDFGGFQEHLTAPGEEFESSLHVSHGEPTHHTHSNYQNHHASYVPNVYQIPFCLQRINQGYPNPSPISQYPQYYLPQQVVYPSPDHSNYKVLISHSQDDATQNSYNKNLYLAPSGSEANNVYATVYKNRQGIDYHDKKKSVIPFTSENPAVKIVHKLTEQLPKLQDTKSTITDAKNIDLKKRKLNDEIKVLEDTLGVFREKLNSEKDITGLRRKRSTDEGLDTVISKLEGRINYLRHEMAQLPDYKASLNGDLDQISARSYESNSYETPEYYKPKPNYSVNMKKEEKFDKLFIKLLKFVLHKVGISAPYVFEFLFGSDSYNNDYDYGQSNQYSQYNNGNELQYGFDNYSNNFSLFGLSGLLPTIFFRILGKIPQFIRFLQRNIFIRNFLVPGGVILIVNGILAFLVWWFFPSDFYNSNQNTNYISSYPSNYNVQPYYS